MEKIGLKKRSTELPGVESKDWLPDRIMSIRHLCETSLLLIEQNRRELLPTQLENLFYIAQQILDEHCVKRNDEGII